MDKRLLDILDREFYDKIENKDFPNRKKILVSFSGVPYSGYDEIAGDLEERFGAVRIEKDLARTLIYENEKIESVKHAEDLINEYVEILLERIKGLPNKFVILQASVDRHYMDIKQWADENGYRLFVIGTQENRDTAMKRVRDDKDPQTADWFESQYDRWYADFEHFKHHIGPDFMIEEDTIKSETDLFRRLDILQETL